MPPNNPFSRPPTDRYVLPLVAIALLLVVAIPGSAGASPPRAATSLRSASGVADSLVLTLVPAPATGNVPVEVNVTARIGGGTAPYNLSLCFGTQDHTSPPPNCGTGTSGWSGTTSLVYSHTYASPGNFSVTGIATDARGQGVGSTALIVVTDRNALAANAIELTGSGPAPLAATFNESVSGGTPPITLQWSFGDGSSGSELPGIPVTHVYQTPGVYTPRLTVTDGAGHSTVRTLAAITASAGAGSGGGLSGALGPTGLADLVVVFAGAAAVVAGAVRFAVLRRWRTEGDQLVASLPTESGRAPTPPSSP